jgi:hypothetical protein
MVPEENIPLLMDPIEQDEALSSSQQPALRIAAAFLWNAASSS